MNAPTPAIVTRKVRRANSSEEYAFPIGFLRDLSATGRPRAS
jgi:hypothetical protein